MSTKSTALLVAAAALLFGFILFVEHPFRMAAQIPADQNVLPGLDPAKVSAVEVQFGGESRIIRVEKSNGLWQLTVPSPYPAAGRLVEKLLHELARWDWESVIDRPGNWEEYGLVKNQFTITLEEDDGPRTLSIGNLSPVGDKVYLNVRGGHQVFVASPQALEWVPTSHLQWRDRSVVNLNGTNFRRLEVSSANGKSVLELDAGLWKMTGPIEARADTPTINLWLGRLQALLVHGFPPDDTLETNASGVSGAPQTQQLVLTFLRDASETNKAMELQVGAGHGKETNLAYARRLFPPGLIEITNTVLRPWEGDYTNFLDRHLFSVSPDGIGSIEAEGGDIEKFTVQKTDGDAWRVACTNGESFLADEAIMKEWLSALTNIEVNSGRSLVADKAPYGLDKPAGALLHYQLYYAGAPGQTNQAMTDLLFGTNQTAQIFELGNDEKTVNTIEFAQFDRLPRFYWQLRDRAIWRFESNEVTAIDIHQEGVQLRLTRDAQNQWTAPRGTIVVPIQAAIDETLYRMGRLQAVYWSGMGDDHLRQFGFDQADYRISFEIKRNGNMETNTIEFGKLSPYYQPYASVMRDGRRFVFEFPVDFYSGLVANYLAVPAEYRTKR